MTRTPVACKTASNAAVKLASRSGAWKLLGLDLRSQGYASFAAGYTDTGHQSLTKTSESGVQVSFTLRSDNPDGTVQTYQGTDTVTGGTIVAAKIVQTS
jgi:hypothetical protein